jgi:hypothetical protein
MAEGLMALFSVLRDICSIFGLFKKPPKKRPVKVQVTVEVNDE